MVLESTVICVDNSDYMRNGDFVPTRLQAQQDAVSVVCHSKTRQHPENNVGLVTLGGGQVLLTLTSDVGRILSQLHGVGANGSISFINSVRIAQLILKHRQGRHHRQRIITFVGSPVEEEEKEIVKLAKRLKKEKVSVDIVNFGEHAENHEKMTRFVDTINGDKEGGSSHLVTVAPGTLLSEILINSPILASEDGQPTSHGAMGGGGFEFGIDPNEDPELALALRVSLEEQRARQEEEARQAAQGGGASDKGTATAAEEGGLSTAATPATVVDDELMAAAGGRGASSGGFDTRVDSSAVSGLLGSRPPTNFESMTEEEQIAFALRMSLGQEGLADSVAPMDTDEGEEAAGGSASSKQDEEEFAEAMPDPEFLQDILSTLPGVDTQSDEIKEAMEQLRKKKDEDDGKA